MTSPHASTGSTTRSAPRWKPTAPTPTRRGGGCARGTHVRGVTVAGGGPTFTLGHNLLTEPEIHGNEDFVTSVIGLGVETDPDTQERLHTQMWDFDLLAQGWPQITRLVDRTDITTLGGLEDQVTGQLLADNESDSDEMVLEVDPNDALWPWGSWDLGDDCHVIIEPGVSGWWPDGYNAERRIVAHRWTVNEEGERLSIVTGRPWQSTVST